MLRSDGLSREAFMPLWRDAMWHTTSLVDRARLVLELGRLNAREFGKADPLVVGYAERREPPLFVLSLKDAPTHANAALRQATQAKLAEANATEAYALVTLAMPQAASRSPGYLLAVWAERRPGAPAAPDEPAEVCWLEAFRWVGEELEETEPMLAPDPRQTEVSRQLAGLLVPHH